MSEIKSKIIQALNLNDMFECFTEEDLLDILINVFKHRSTKIDQLETALQKGSQDLLNERNSFQIERNRLRSQPSNREYYFLTHDKKKYIVRFNNVTVSLFKRMTSYDECAIQLTKEEFNK